MKEWEYRKVKVNLSNQITSSIYRVDQPYKLRWIRYGINLWRSHSSNSSSMTCLRCKNQVLWAWWTPNNLGWILWCKLLCTWTQWWINKISSSSRTYHKILQYRVRILYLLMSTHLPKRRTLLRMKLSKPQTTWLEC